LQRGYMRLFMLILFICLSTPAHAELKQVTIRGVVGWGSSDSAIDGLQPYCIFATDSKVANTVFNTCKVDDECEIHGVIDEYSNLIKIITIRKIDTKEEPSIDVIKDSIYWASLNSQETPHPASSTPTPVIENYNVNTINNERVYEIKYKFNAHDCAERTLNTSCSGIVYLVTRGGKWHYQKQSTQ